MAVVDAGGWTLVSSHATGQDKLLTVAEWRLLQAQRRRSARYVQTGWTANQYDP